MAIDLHKSIFRHDWISADSEMYEILDMKYKEDGTVLFEVVLIYTYTNYNSLKSHSLNCKLFDLPYQYNFNNFGPIKILLEPPS